MARRGGAVVRVVFNNFAAIADKLPGAAMEAIEETIVDIDVAVKTGMASSGGGRTYTRGGSVHVASSPGNMPAIDMGALINSLQHEIIRGKYRGYYYTNMEYAAYLEYGTSKMAPRPFMTPAAERAREAFISRMRNLESKLR